MVPRLSLQILLILLQLIMGLGCVGTQTIDLTRPETGTTVREIGDAVVGDAVTVTCIDGMLYEGEVLSQTDSNLVFSSAEIAGSLYISWKRVHQLLVSGRLLYIYAGAVGGSLAGGLVGSWVDPATSEPVDFGGAPIGGLVGAFVGGTMVGRLGAERRYVIQPLNDCRDTLSVNETDILVETSK